VGCDFQLVPNWVIGIDADASGANISGASNQAASVGFTGFSVPALTTVSSAGTLSTKANFISTVTRRLGYTFGYMGKGLFYGKAEAASTNDSYSFVGQTSTQSCNTRLITLPDDPVGPCSIFNPIVRSPFNFGLSETSIGWTIETGIEWAVLNNWSVKLEYDYLDFSSHNLKFANPVPNISVSRRISEVKFGVNYLLGWQ
jgi:opacity protein-like surface antigen